MQKKLKTYKLMKGAKTYKQPTKGSDNKNYLRYDLTLNVS